VDELLERTGWTLDNFDFFASVVGAGSFTGIRIGISVIKGFCLATGKPSLPVTSFDVVAYNSVEADEKLLCLVDALHDAYYVCGYEGERVVYPPQYISEAEVLSLKEQGYRLASCSVLPIGEKAEVQKVNPVTGLANAVKQLSKAGKFGELTALYVRKSSAELNLK
jgi:tRNA threonylcarbamoyl adenosine modification protein YeaZ